MYQLNNPQTSGFPSIQEDLVNALDEMFPERCPDPRMDDRTIWMDVGKREVVRFLKALHEEQTRNILE